MGARILLGMGYRTGPPGYIGWRNSFLGINSGALLTFKNTGSVLYCTYCVWRLTVASPKQAIERKNPKKERNWHVFRF
jgi:hypothetical protein